MKHHHHTPKESAWLDRYMEIGNATQSAKDAGYSPHTATVKGSKLKKKFASEIAERVAANFRDKSPLMAHIIEDLAKTATSEQVRYKAAADYLDRGGFKPTEKYEEVNKPEMSYEEMLDKLMSALPNLLTDLWPKIPKEKQNAILNAINTAVGRTNKADMPGNVQAGQNESNQTLN